MSRVLMCVFFLMVAAFPVRSDGPLADIARNLETNLDALKSLPKSFEGATAATAAYANVDKMKRAIDDFNKGIYRFDDRKNLFEVGSPAKRAASSTVVLIEAMSVDPSADGSVTLPNTTAGLCTPAQLTEIKGPNGETYETEPFSDEPAPGNCSGFKVGSDVIATAAHCVRDDAHCRAIKFVVGFSKSSKDGAVNLTIPKSQIYSCKKLIDRKHTDTQEDWALVQVDRELAEMPSVTLAAPKLLKQSEGVTVVGYPMGLPVKVAAGARVRRLEKTYFVANLDTYGGNSGSPVFNTDALLRDELVVEGILVRGENDFVVKSPCRVSKRCAENGCRGEDVVYVEEFRTALQKHLAGN